MFQKQAMVKKNASSEKPAIIVKNVTKEFIIPHERKTTLFENIKGIFRPSTYETFTALKDVSFTVEKGESIGIIGDNGSGKSTLLKIISRILKPTRGSVEVNGRITPFLELGVGFQPDLTAKENIEVYSTIMGLSEKEIARNIDNVLEFAGLTKFRDTKLKNFSSGMQVRLAFATAIQREPDILLVDEVLAVGDMDFQQKCLDVFTEYKKKGVTMLFVSHDLGAVRRFCDKTMLMKNGKILAYGKTGDVIDRYVYGVDKSEAQPQNKVEPIVHLEAKEKTIEPLVQDDVQKPDVIKPEQNLGEPSTVRKDRWGNQKIIIKYVKLLDKYGKENDRFNTNDPLTIRIFYHANELISDPIFGIAIYGEHDLQYYGTNTDIQGLNVGTVTGDNVIEIKIPSLPMTAGRFLLTVAVHSRNHIPYDWHDKKYLFSIINTGRTVGIIDLKSEWKLNVD
ncbi:ABC transporter ATP-binding protein [Methanocella conradii]|uniref:ABC transporter ATP-binding protein n=1 Tax=Methanocella conradii TaxID=1175444 RepID=UPI00157CDBA8|nr:ABC transporter ATP-binding protein [Methanocella conradii]